MPKARSPNRDKAFEIWRDSGGTEPLKNIAEQLGVSDTQVRKWKNQDQWEDAFNGNGVTIRNGNVTNQTNSNVTKKIGPPKGNQNAKGHGAPKGNKNAVGNSGGIGGIPGAGNQNFKHGFFCKIFPDDEETREIVETINIKSPLEMLWENIVIQYTAIARAQRLMYVRNQEDITKELRSSSSSENGDSESYIIQFAWDRHAAFMQAQSKAMTTLQNLISKYETMLLKDMETEEQRLRLEKLKADINKIKGDGDKETGIADELKKARERAMNGKAKTDGNSATNN